MKKIAISPALEFQAGVSTFLDPKKFEIMTDFKIQKESDRFPGEWCAPIKHHIDYYISAKNNNADILIAPNLPYCKYPFALAQIKSSPLFNGCEVISINSPKLDNSIKFMFNAYKEFKKLHRSRKFLLSYLKKLPIALKRSLIAEEIRTAYYSSLPLVRVPKLLKLKYTNCINEFIPATTLKHSIDIKNKFIKYCNKKAIKPSSEFKFLISGDYSIITTSQFAQFDIALHLSKLGSEIINPYSPTFSLFQHRFSKESRKASSLINSENASVVTYLERITIMQILKGIKANIDGILYIKPVMCTPTENASTILKANKYFGVPFVELTYDDFSNSKGLETRLEAFVNIVRENSSDEPKFSNDHINLR
jgi:hypothetical protein